MVEYYREGALVGQEVPTTDTRTQYEIGMESPMGFQDIAPLATYQPSQRSDIGLAFSKGSRLLLGSGVTTFKGFTGSLLKEFGLEEAGARWLSDAYQSGLLMGMDVNEIDEQLKGPKNLGEIEDWKGAIAWGMNAVAEQVPNLMTTFAPAVIGTVIFKRPTLGTVGTLGAIDFLNTAEVYTDLLMETTESRPAVAASTGALMSLLDMIVPMRVLGKMGLGNDFASYFGKKIKDPRSGWPQMIGEMLANGAREGVTEYAQTMMEGMALNYVKENDKLFEFTQAQQEEQLEAGARGALVGSLLGIPISYAGRSARKKAKEYSNDALDDLVNKNINANKEDEAALGGEGFVLHGDTTVVSTAEKRILDEEGKRLFKEPLRSEWVVNSKGEQILRPNSEYERFLRTGEIEPIRFGEIARRFQAIEKGEDFMVTPEEAEVYRRKGIEIRKLIEKFNDQDRVNEINKKATARLKRLGIDAIYNYNVKSHDPEISWLRRKAVQDRYDPEPVVPTGDPSERPLTINPTTISRLLRIGKEKRARKAADTTARMQQPSEEKYKYKATDPIVATVKGKQRLPLGLPQQEDRDQRTTSEAKKLGWSIDNTTLVVTSTGDAKQKNNKNEYRSVYENPEYIVKKASPEGPTTADSATTLSISDWVVIDKSDGSVIKRVPAGKTTREQFNKSVEAGKPIFPVEIYMEGESNLRQLINEFADTTYDPRVEPQEVSDLESRSLEQLLSVTEKIIPTVGNKIRLFNKKKGVFSDDIVYTLDEPIKKITNKKTGAIGKRYVVTPVAGGVQKVIDLYPKKAPTVEETKKAKEVLETKRKEGTETKIRKPDESLKGDYIFVDHLRFAQLLREYDETRTTDEEAYVQDPLRTEEDRQEFLAEARKDEQYDVDVTDTGIEIERIEPKPDESGKTLLAGEQVQSNRQVLVEELNKNKKFKQNLIKVLTRLEFWNARAAKLSKQTTDAEKKGIISDETFEDDVPSDFDFLEKRTIGKKETSIQAFFNKKEKNFALLAGSDLDNIKKWVAKYARETSKQINKNIEDGIISEKDYANKELEVGRYIDEQVGVITAREKPETTRQEGIDVTAIDPRTGLRPTPETFRVKLTPSAAKKYGLAPNVFYEWETFSFPQWGESRDDFIKVAGQLVRQVRRGAESSEIVNVEKKRTIKKIKRDDFIETDPSVLPNTVPNKEGIDQAFIDPKSGVFIVRRAVDVGEGASRYDMYDFEVYLTYNDKLEYQGKIQNLNETLVEYEAMYVPTEEGPLTTALVKKIIPVQVYIEAIRTRPPGKIKKKKIKELITTDRFGTKDEVVQKISSGDLQRVLKLKDAKVKVKVSPSIVAKINSERKNLGMNPIETDAEFDVSLSRKSDNVIVNYEGSIREIKASSVVELSVESFVPNRVGAIEQYTTYLERTPETRGARLIASFKGESGQDMIAYSDFLEEMYGDTAHKYGMFGTERENMVEARTREFDKHSGEKVMLTLSGGQEIVGTITGVSDGTIRFYYPKTVKPVEIDVLNVERFQPLLKKPTYVAQEAVDDSIKISGNMVVFSPATPEKREFQTEDESPLKVQVFLRKDGTYRITVDGVTEETDLSAKGTVDFLNDLNKSSKGNINVYKLPDGIRKIEVAPVSLQIADKIDQGFVGPMPKDNMIRFVFEVGGEKINPLTGTIEKKGYGKDVSYETVADPLTGLKYKRRSDLVEAVSDNDVNALEKDVDKELTPTVKALGKVIEEVNKAEQIALEEKENNIQRDNYTARILPYEEVSSKPFSILPIGQEFVDRKGTQWEVALHDGRNTYLKFIGGKAPEFNFKLNKKGKNDEGKFEEGMEIAVFSGSTPSAMRVEVQLEDKSIGYDKYSIVNPVPADGTGSMSYNTGLTPNRFKELLGPLVGKLNVARLVNKGLIKIVQNQSDVPNAPLELGVKSVTRNGELIFITNNIREEEIMPVYIHEVGVHIGLKDFFSKYFPSLIEEVKLKRQDKAWADAFKNAEMVANQFTFTDSIARENFVAEEAMGYYIESTNNFKDSLWQKLIDAFNRSVAKIKMWFNKKLSNEEIVSFIRGAVRGMSERNFEDALNKVDEQYYSVANAGERAVDYLGGAVQDKLKDIDSARQTNYVQKSNAVWGSVKKFFDPFVALPKARLFRQMRSLLHGDLGKIEALGKAVIKNFADLTEAQNEELFKFFTTKGHVIDEKTVTNADLRRKAQALKIEIENIADAGLLRGIFPEASMEQLEELRGAYLPRVYMYWLLKSDERQPGQRTLGSMRYVKKREDELVEELADLWGQQKDVQYLLYRAVTVPQQDMAIIDFLSALSKRIAFSDTDEFRILNENIATKKEQIKEAKKAKDEEKVKSLNKELKDLNTAKKNFAGPRTQMGDTPWVMPNQWIEIEFTYRGKTVKQRTTLASLNNQINDLQEHLRLSNKVLKESAKETIQKRIADLEMARFNFFQSIEPSIKSKDEVAGKDQQEKILQPYYSSEYDINNFRRIPDNHKYGSMAGLWVRKEIHDDLVGNSDMVYGEANMFQKLFLPYGRHAKLVSIYKMMKVPMNPPTVVRNFVSNLVLLQLIGGVPFHKQPALLSAALKELRGMDSGKVFTHSTQKDENGNPRKFTAYELAKEQGISASTLTSAEMKKLEEVFQHMEKDGIWSIATGGKKVWNKLAGFSGDLYQNIELLGKVMAIMHKLETKSQRAELQDILANSDTPELSIEDIAIQESNRILFDYSEVHPFVRGARSSFLGAPFITFQVKVLPELLKVAIKHPYRFLPYAMMLGGMQAVFGSIPWVDDDWDKLEKLLPEWTKDNTMVFLPWKDSNGNIQAVDLSYFFPWSFYTQTFSHLRQGEFSRALVEGGIMGPMFQMATAISTGIDPWSQRPISNENDPLSDRVFDKMSYMNSMIMPPWLTRTGIVSLSSLGEAMFRLDPREVEGKLADLMLGRENVFGEPRRSFMGVLGAAVGLNPYAVSPKARSRQLRRFDVDIRKLESEIDYVKTNRKLSKNERVRKVNELKTRVDQAREDKGEFRKATANIKRTL